MIGNTTNILNDEPTESDKKDLISTPSLWCCLILVKIINYWTVNFVYSV